MFVVHKSMESMNEVRTAETAISEAVGSSASLMDR